MKTSRLHRVGQGLLVATLLSGCATTQPAPVQEAPLTPTVVKFDETAMLPLLGYLQLLSRLTPQELVRERHVLAAIPQTPATLVRMAILLGQPRAATDLVRALGILEGVLKSSDPAATSLHPLVRALATQYNERLKLEMQNEKLVQQLKESQRRSSELQEKLDALADIERSLPVRPTAGDSHSGGPR